MIMPRKKIALFASSLGMFLLIVLLNLMNSRQTITGHIIKETTMEEGSLVLIFLTVSILAGLLTFGHIHKHFNKY